MVVAVAGDVDGATAPSLDAALSQVGGGGQSIVVDLGDLRFIDSTGLNCLVRAANRVRPEGGNVTVRNLRPHVRRLFTIAGMQQVVEIA